MSFTGFGKEALPFFKALKFHQSREWFEQNRTLYDEQVFEPFVVFLDDLTAELAKRRLPLKAEGKRSIFRIHRDTRFSKDKTPYKTHAGAVLTRSGRKDDPGLLYVHISPEGCFTAAGFHNLEPAPLSAMRTAIKVKSARFRAVLDKLGKGKVELNAENALTRLPRGFQDVPPGPIADAIRLRSFIVEEPLADKLIASPKLVGAVADFAERAVPLLNFGWDALA